MNYFLTLSLLIISYAVCGQSTNDFENTPIGPLRDFKGWHAANISPGAEIVDLSDNAYKRVLKLNANSKKQLTAFYSFPSANSGKLIIDFDFKTNSYDIQPRIALALQKTSLKQLPYNSAVWLGLGYKEKLQYYSQGWTPVGAFALNKWHHMKITVNISGEDKGTFSLNLNGGEVELLGATWRNKLTNLDEIPLGKLFFQIKKSTDPDKYLMIDNVRTTATPDEKLLSRVINDSFHSKVLNRKKEFTVFLPEEYKKSDQKFPVLYLLHGRGRNERSLTGNARALNILKNAKFVTVFPDGDDGWYINSPIKKNDRYNDYMEELMSFVEKKYRISSNPAQRGLSGWSMGGYGCTMYAAAHPAQFSAVAPMIALLDYPRSGLPKGQSYKVVSSRFGNDEAIWEKFNPIHYAEKLKGKNILLVSANQCFTKTMNNNFANRLKELNISCELKKIKGSHSFETVLTALPLVIDFMNKQIVSDMPGQ